MPPFGPISRSDLIRSLRRAGFAGPFVGTKHQLMLRGTVRVRVPNPHQGDVGRELLIRIIRQAGLSREEWEAL